MTVLMVGVAGMAGVVARYGLTVWVQSIWTVVAVNIVGSFLLGLLVQAGAELSHELRTALSVGFLGGFTTFSTLTVQTVLDTDAGRTASAAAYLGVTVVGGLLAAVAGYALGRAIS